MRNLVEPVAEKHGYLPAVRGIVINILSTKPIGYKEAINLSIEYARIFPNILDEPEVKDEGELIPGTRLRRNKSGKVI